MLDKQNVVVVVVIVISINITDFLQSVQYLVTVCAHTVLMHIVLTPDR